MQRIAKCCANKITEPNLENKTNRASNAELLCHKDYQRSIAKLKDEIEDNRVKMKKCVDGVWNEK